MTGHRRIADGAGIIARWSGGGRDTAGEREGAGEGEAGPFSACEKSGLGH